MAKMQLAEAALRRGLSVIPDELDFSLESWHDGTCRRYKCKLTHAARNESWVSAAYDSPEAAVNDALTRCNIPPVDAGFWRGARSALPYALVSWVVMIAIGAMIWHLLAA